MKQNQILPLVLLVIFLLPGKSIWSQKLKFDRKKQLIVGIKGGVNFTHTLLIKSHSVMSATVNSSNGSAVKKYDPLIKNMGFNGGIFLLYRLTNRISVGMEGLFFQYKYAYTNTYTWEDADEGTSFILEQKHTNRLHYFEIPVLLRYDLTIRKVTPFFQGGLYTGFLHSGISQTQSIQTSGQVYPVTPIENPSIQTNDRFARIGLGVLGGAGISFFAGRVMFSLGGNVRYSLIQPMGNLYRYNDDASFSSAYLDVADHINLLNMELYFSIGVPIGLSGGGQPKFGTNYCTY